MLEARLLTFSIKQIDGVSAVAGGGGGAAGGSTSAGKPPGLAGYGEQEVALIVDGLTSGAAVSGKRAAELAAALAGGCGGGGGGGKLGVQQVRASAVACSRAHSFRVKIIFCCSHRTMPRALRQQDFAYTAAAARRAEERRLLRFVRLLDFMLGVSWPGDDFAAAYVGRLPYALRRVPACESAVNLIDTTVMPTFPRHQDALRSCLVASAAELLARTRPPPPEAPQQSAGCAPLFAVAVVLRGAEGGEGGRLELEPSREEVKACTAEVIAGFRECATNIDRLYAQVSCQVFSIACLRKRYLIVTIIQVMNYQDYYYIFIGSNWNQACANPSSAAGLAGPGRDRRGRRRPGGRARNGPRCGQRLRAAGESLQLQVKGFWLE